VPRSSANVTSRRFADYRETIVRPTGQLKSGESNSLLLGESFHGRFRHHDSGSGSFSLAPASAKSITKSSRRTIGVSSKPIKTGTPVRPSDRTGKFHHEFPLAQRRVVQVDDKTFGRRELRDSANCLHQEPNTCKITRSCLGPMTTR